MEPKPKRRRRTGPEGFEGKIKASQKPDKKGNYYVGELESWEDVLTRAKDKILTGTITGEELEDSDGDGVPISKNRRKSSDRIARRNSQQLSPAQKAQLEEQTLFWAGTLGARGAKAYLDSTMTMRIGHAGAYPQMPDVVVTTQQAVGSKSLLDFMDSTTRSEKEKSDSLGSYCRRLIQYVEQWDAYQRLQREANDDKSDTWQDMQSLGLTLQQGRGTRTLVKAYILHRFRNVGLDEASAKEKDIRDPYIKSKKNALNNQLSTGRCYSVISKALTRGVFLMLPEQSPAR
ncbi:MAG: hypothetical protein Q9174_007420 [Haloplaca sp. 1 TL-2023]